LSSKWDKEMDAAELLVNNWRLHDGQRYLDIRKNSENLLLELGYGSSSARASGRIIEAIYRNADIAEGCMKSHPNKEQNIYRGLERNCDRLDKTLGRQRNSKRELMWWKAIRHKSVAVACFYLFADQLSKFGCAKCVDAASATVSLFKAGMAHDDKDWELCVREVKKLMNTVRASGVKNYIEF
jgi:hypothetical protein